MRNDKELSEALLRLKCWYPIASILEAHLDGFWGILKGTFWACVLLAIILFILEAIKVTFKALFSIF